VAASADALEKVGMKVTDSTVQPAAWRQPISRCPTALAGTGRTRPSWLRRLQTQVGDLDNRSSLQFIDPKGHTLTQSQNDALVAFPGRIQQVK
jgi:outer membrane protein assembly factor BamC